VNLYAYCVKLSGQDRLGLSY